MLFETETMRLRAVNTRALELVLFWKALSPQLQDRH